MGAKEINAPAAQDALAETKEDADVCQLRLLTTHPMKLSDDVCSLQLRPSRNKLWASLFFYSIKNHFFLGVRSPLSSSSPHFRLQPFCSRHGGSPRWHLSPLIVYKTRAADEKIRRWPDATSSQRTNRKRIPSEGLSEWWRIAVSSCS